MIFDATPTYIKNYLCHIVLYFFKILILKLDCSDLQGVRPNFWLSPGRMGQVLNLDGNYPANRM